MKSIAASLAVLSALMSTAPAFAQRSLDESIRARADASWAEARKIWEWAEVGYHEDRSAALLSDSLEAAGFRVERGVAGIPTAFIATIGSGKPVIAILGEFDALPGLAQESVPEREAARGLSAGHGCGHHLFGVASASASIAIAEQLRSGALEGTLRYYGCPAEEGGSAKAFLVRAGLFNDCDAVLHWHPPRGTRPATRPARPGSPPSFGSGARARMPPGPPSRADRRSMPSSSTDHAAELLREHTPDFTRIHHVITAGGSAPNVVPDFAEAFYYIRHPRSDVVRKLYPRLLKCAAGRGPGHRDRARNRVSGRNRRDPAERNTRASGPENLLRLNDLSYDDAEKAFAAKIRETLESRFRSNPSAAS